MTHPVKYGLLQAIGSTTVLRQHWTPETSVAAGFVNVTSFPYTPPDYYID